MTFPAQAQPSAGPPAGVGAAKDKAPASGDKPKIEVSRVGGRKVFRITTSWVIEGRVAKPNAFYLLQRSEINFDWARMKRNFLPRIGEALADESFHRSGPGAPAR